MPSASLVKEFENLIGKENVFTSEADRQSYAYDAAVLPSVVPGLVLRPTSTEQLGALIERCYANGLPMTIRGAGTNLSGGTVPDADKSVVILTQGLNKIIEINEEDLFAIVEPGVVTAQFAAAVRELLRDKLEAYAQKGQVGRVVRVMVLGIPNVGKSTFINKVARRKSAKAEDRPGVTRSKQWVPVDSTLELLDTPGILWPKFDDPEVGKRLAFTGAIKDDVLDIEELACYLMEYLGQHYASVLEERYKIAVEPEDSGYDLLEKAGRKRGFLMRGAQVDTERMARILLDEFRGGKLGRFTLETVEDAT